ncbi:lipase family protein [uncultured Mitsuokella sp.]|uniref:lipase family protein n=1 Tax=uncultured Mitsuokella sp. TaxID=453120 RepID=UPI002591D6BB|nr:thioesterase domain-containing protein [uncultured Mitsuokella sp.]
MMRHALATLLLPLVLVLGLLCPARAMAATGEQELELLSSLVAMASYSDELSLLAREWLAETGWEFQSQTTATSLAQGRYHLVTKEMPDGHRAVLLAFPGTENAKDAKVDLRTRSVPFGGSSVEEFRDVAQQDRHATSYPLVHKGFDDYTMTALFHKPVDLAGSGACETMGEHLAQELRAHPTEVLYLTGHSLGGAAAILTAARLSDMGVRPEQLRVITFGSPAVGNVAFARYYEKRMQLTRIVMDGDPVAAALQSLGTRYVQFGERVAWKQDRSSARFEHAMVVYLDRALRLYFSEDEVGDGDMLESRPLAARGGIFVAVPQLDLDPLVAGDDTADIRILQGAWQARYAPCTVQSDGQRGADMDVLIAEARAAQCRYAVRQHVSVKRSRDEADTVRVVLETSVYDAQGTFITVVSKSTTDRRMTPLEAVAYLQFATLRDLDTVFVTQNT